MIKKQIFIILILCVIVSMSNGVNLFANTASDNGPQVKKAQETAAEKAKKDEAGEEKKETKPEPVPEKYKPYAGTYIADFAPYKGKKFIVGAKNGQLAAQVPGREMMELSEPGDDGLWHFKRAKSAAFEFIKDDKGIVDSFRMYQINLLVKKKEEEGVEQPAEKSTPTATPPTGKYAEYVGDYINMTSVVVFRAFLQDEKLFLEYRAKDKIELVPPDEKGRWFFSVDPQVYVTFGPGARGEGIIMKLHQFVSIPKVDETVAEIK